MSSRVGRVLRDHLRGMETANSPEGIRDCLARQAAGKAATRAREERFPILSAANAKEAMAYQEEFYRAEYARLLAMPAAPVKPRRRSKR